MKKLTLLTVGVGFTFLGGITACDRERVECTNKPHNVIIIVIDGPRYAETWGNVNGSYISLRANGLAKLGTVCTNMHNDGATLTTPGHTAVTTGVYEDIANDGSEYPTAPSFMHYWLRQTQQASDKAWIITSKDKLSVLTDCTRPGWKGAYTPRSDCGNPGSRSDSRNDTATFNRVIEVLTQFHPHLVLINFKEPDVSGHARDWEGYLNGIRSTDFLSYKIWEYLQNDSTYKDNTTLLITNDHGRHTHDYTSHGDGCAGCRHIECLAIGPRFKADYVDTGRHSQIDIAATVADLLGIQMENIPGKKMQELYK
jgi:arylsulfatase A-like enzyme